MSKAVAAFHELAGPSFYRRIDVHVERALYDGVEAAAAGRPRRDAADGARRRARRADQVLSTNDGFKWFLADGSWLLVRASGTEPLVRVYTEATSAELRDELVVTGERLVRGR